MSESKPRILAVGAHPDDIEFGCGGILLAAAAAGSEVALCVCSRGEAGSNGTPDEREAEARRAAELLGATITFLDLGGDCHLEVSPAGNIAIAREIRAAQPGILLGPVAVSEQHPDHVVVSHLCRNAARLARYAGLGELRDLPPHAIMHHLEYAITPGAEPVRNGRAIRVNISEYFARWVQLMECHQTQLRTRRYVDLQTARARSLGLDAGVEYTQALFPTADFLIQSLDDLPPSVRLF
ncbi:MAG TPA: PIG-L family deacetylase [Chthoniobacterales bacterium]|jgi:LmbE family N-acetylglucosaminyl deacetylase|nr:PIG-L family deacetylase [Chthoniobacterales bacterium]